MTAANGETDISFELKVLDEGRGVRQRALAVQALYRLAETFGTTPTEEQIAAVRGLSKEEARMSRIAMVGSVSVLPAAPVFDIDPREASESTVIIDEGIIDTRPVEDDPKQNPAETAMSKEVEQDSKALRQRALEWLSAFRDDYNELTVDDIPRVAQEIAQQTVGPKTRLNYAAIVQGYLIGTSYDVLAAAEGSTASTVQQTIVLIKKKMVAKRQDDTREGDVKSITSEFDPDVDHFSVLEESVRSPKTVTQEKWKKSAETLIPALAYDAGLTEEQGRILWDHLHYNAKNTHQDVSDAYKEILESLRESVGSLLATEAYQLNESTKKIALRSFFIGIDGTGTLDTVFGSLRKRDYNVTVTATYVERLSTLAFAELLKQAALDTGE